MKRRKFQYQTSAGIAAILLSKGVWAGSFFSGEWRSCKFSNYSEGSFVVPVKKVTTDDGSDCIALSGFFWGNGHPGIHIVGNYLLADAYSKQQYVNGADGRAGLRLLNLNLTSDTEVQLGNIPNEVGAGLKQSLPEDIISGGSQHKLDPHPAWSGNYQQICFNVVPLAKRQVFIADLQNLIS